MKSRAGIFTAVLVAIMMIAGVAVAAAHLVASTTDTQPVLLFSDGVTDTGGESHLTRTSGMATVVVDGQSLVPGDVHTLWWVVFNNPAGCSNPCGENDIFDENGLNATGIAAADIAIGNATGNVAKSDGSIELGGVLKMGDDGGHQVLFVPSDFGGSGDHLLNVPPDDAEFHVIVQTHGNARGGNQLLTQLSMVEFGCTPGCADIQFAVHAP